MIDLAAAFVGEVKTDRTTGRREHDAYMTPAVLANAIVDRVEATLAEVATSQITPIVPGRILEPTCGSGDFLRALREKWPEAIRVGVDLRDEVKVDVEAAGARFVHADYLTVPLAPIASADLIITNPPFAILDKIVTHTLRGMREGVCAAFLIRLAVIAWGEDGRVRFWNDAISECGGLSANRQIIRVFPICPRPSFTGDGKTDAQEYGIVVLKKGHDNGGAFEPIVWDRPKKRRGRKARNGVIGG